MKQSLLFAALVVGLGACQKSDNNEDATPAAMEAAFSQDFTLSYRQQALLPTVAQPELTVELADLQYSICPKNARCFTANFVFPLLAITDAQGRTQQLKMPVNNTTGLQTGAFIDTASVRANGRRYLVQYTSWQAKETDRNYAEKQDLSVKLRITKPAGN
ncbi:hypothetical protein [Hymenobacter canadensis]|uniref:Lipoprotein n=1 Tax=Hymenobacter canadensis TaxID=2999067 RepID=A0ABY7LSV8_9BACT|nr:hypothetical protein [Hymenobacter canadensis]WBA43474.1 hypothetical protein O3303_07865 [Hymenobacter canadensis]